MIPKPKFAIAYTRAALPSENIEYQRQMIYNYAKSTGYTIVSYIEHNGRSGLNTDFTWLYKILKRHRGKIGFVIMDSKDRLSRNVLDLILLEQHLQDNYNVIIDTVRKFAACTQIK